MPATFRHFAINADDVPRARHFYEGVFGWKFEPWGPPNFYQVKNAGTGLLGALQERRDIVPNVRAACFETSFGVEDLKATIAAIDHGISRKSGAARSSCSRIVSKESVNSSTSRTRRAILSVLCNMTRASSIER